MSMSNSFYKAYENVKAQQSKDFAFLQKHFQIKQRIASQNKAKLSSWQERTRINLKRFSKNVILNNQLQKERLQRIKSKHSFNRNTINCQSPSPCNSTSVSHSLLLQSPLYKTCTPSSLSHTNFLITKTRNDNETLRKSYESLIYTRLSTFTANKREHMHQIRNKFNAYNTFVNGKTQKARATKLLTTDRLKDDLDMKGAAQLHRYDKQVHSKAQSLNVYNEYLRQHNAEVKMRANELRQYNLTELKRIVNDAINGSYQDRVPKNSFRFTASQLKMIRKERETKEKVEIFKRNEMRKKEETDNEILINEYRKFGKVCKKEKERLSTRETLLLRTIRKQEKDDNDMVEIRKDIEHVKDKSIYKHL